MKKVESEPRNVLLVHDHAGMSDALSKGLGKFGHFCFLAKSFSEAEEILRETVIHVILCDCSINGVSPFGFIAASADPREIPCHLISAAPEYWNKSWEKLSDRRQHAGRVIDLQQETENGYALLRAKIAEAPMSIE